MLEERHHEFMRLVSLSDCKLNTNELYDFIEKETTLFRDVDLFYKTLLELLDMDYIYTNDADKVCIKHPKGFDYLERRILNDKKKATKKPINILKDIILPIVVALIAAYIIYKLGWN